MKKLICDKCGKVVDETEFIDSIFTEIYEMPELCEDCHSDMQELIRKWIKEGKSKNSFLGFRRKK